MPPQPPTTLASLTFLPQRKALVLCRSERRYTLHFLAAVQADAVMLDTLQLFESSLKRAVTQWADVDFGLEHLEAPLNGISASDL